MIYVRKIETTDKRFANRTISITSMSLENGSKIPIPGTVVLCNGCNKNLYPDPGYMVYLGKHELKADQPYDTYCKDCLRRYFPKATEVELEGGIIWKK